jgi:hypothetical protein
MSELLAGVSAEVTGRPLQYTDVRLAELLSPEYFVRVRRALGGPAPEETGRALEVEEKSAGRDARWLAEARAALARADQALRECAREL